MTYYGDQTSLALQIAPMHAVCTHLYVCINYRVILSCQSCILFE